MSPSTGTAPAKELVSLVQLDMREFVTLLVKTLGEEQIAPLSDQIASLQTDVAVLKKEVCGNGKPPLQAQIDDLKKEVSESRGRRTVLSWLATSLVALAAAMVGYLLKKG